MKFNVKCDLFYRIWSFWKLMGNWENSGAKVSFYDWDFRLNSLLRIYRLCYRIIVLKIVLMLKKFLVYLGCVNLTQTVILEDFSHVEFVDKSTDTPRLRAPENSSRICIRANLLNIPRKTLKKYTNQQRMTRLINHNSYLKIISPICRKICH